MDNYRKAREMVRQLAPWMKIMDALSDISFAKEHLTDLPIPMIREAVDFVNEGITCWTYYCCAPTGKYLNRFLDTPLAKIRMNGWLLYRWNLEGFLHWGYNWWYDRDKPRQLVDPFLNVGICPRMYGDNYMVYPGADGPIDSIRWEVFRQSMQDYALLQTLNIDKDSSLLSALKSFQDFPKNGKWVHNMRQKLLFGKTRL